MRSEEEIKEALRITIESHLKKKNKWWKMDDGEQKANLDIYLSNSESFITALEWVLNSRSILCDMGQYHLKMCDQEVNS